MIRRENYKLVQAYLTYKADVLQRDAATVKANRCDLRYLLEWADATPFVRAADIRPVYPQYLLGRTNRRGRPFCAKVVQRACRQARLFFEWLRQEEAGFNRRLPAQWLDTLRPPSLPTPASAEREVVTLEMVRALLAVEAGPEDLALWRDQAAAALLFLSGARAAALATLTFECLNLAERTVRQDPTLGVRTKNKKGAVTRLLEIPDLLAAVERWDAYARPRLPATAPWYTVIRYSLGEYGLTPAAPGARRGCHLARRIRLLFERAHLPPRSPHKFRHGHAVYALKLAQGVGDLKAISLNLMHASLETTDRIYAVLSEVDVHARIARLGQGSNGHGDRAALKAALLEMLEQL